MATRRSKLRIVPPILKRVVTVGVIPACVVSAAACGKTQGPPVVAHMAPVVAYMPPPVVASAALPPPPFPVLDVDASPMDAAAPGDASAPKRDAAASTAAPTKTIRAPVVAYMPPDQERDKDPRRK